MSDLKRILLVEDDPKDVELTLTGLAEYNLANEVVVARDGEEALDYLYRRGNYHTRSNGNPAVMLLDLDNFKSINDRFGHATGDHVLELFAEIGGRCIRRHDLFGRLGGEEFAAMLVDTGRDRAVAVAEEIRARFEEATREVEQWGAVAGD